jgi:hypothetical protein
MTGLVRATSPPPQQAGWAGGVLVAWAGPLASITVDAISFALAAAGLSRICSTAWALGVLRAAGVLGSLLAPKVIRRAGRLGTLLIGGVARCLWMGWLLLATPGTTGLLLIVSGSQAGRSARRPHRLCR